MGAMKEPAVSLYDADYHAWVQHQVGLLRRGDLASLDLHHLIDEVESLGRSEERELESRLEQLLMHLLKWQHQPEGRSTSWSGTIREQRRRIEKLFKRMPSLQARLGDFIQDDYEVACAMAAVETGLDLATFPVNCPYPVSRILDPEWLPGAQG